MGTDFFTQAFHTESYFAASADASGLFLFGIFVFHMVRPSAGYANQLVVGWLRLVLQRRARAVLA